MYWQVAYERHCMRWVVQLTWAPPSQSHSMQALIDTTCADRFTDCLPIHWAWDIPQTLASSRTTCMYVRKWTLFPCRLPACLSLVTAVRERIVAKIGRVVIDTVTSSTDSVCAIIWQRHLPFSVLLVLQQGIHLYSLLHVLSVVQHCTALYYTCSLTTCWWLQCRFSHS